MNILAIDLGKFSSTACEYDTGKIEHRFEKVPTRPAVISQLISRSGAERVVIEVGAQAGWVCDICEALKIPVQVASPNHEGWRWKTVKRKTDRDDALKLAKLSAMDQLPCVVLPRTGVRQMRSLITYRQTLVSRRTAIKNSIRSILDRQGVQMPPKHGGWTLESRKALHDMARPIEEAGPDDLWRAQLHIELRALDQVEELHDQVERKLNDLARNNERVARLRTIPGVGPRLAKTIVALIDDPRRFKSGKQVGAYAGLVPAQFESGTSSRQGRITGRGNTLLRALLVEVAWLMRRYNPHFRGVFDRVCQGSPTRRKIAVVAVARRLLVTCWAMLRDGTVWKSPTAETIEECAA
jgi:transposase